MLDDLVVVHEGVLGTRRRPEIGEYTAEVRADGVIAHGVRVFQPDPYGTRRRRPGQLHLLGLRPLTTHLAKESAGPRFSILLMILPAAGGAQDDLDVDGHELWLRDPGLTFGTA